MQHRKSKGCKIAHICARQKCAPIRQEGENVKNIGSYGAIHAGTALWKRKIHVPLESDVRTKRSPLRGRTAVWERGNCGRTTGENISKQSQNGASAGGWRSDLTVV